MTRPVNVALIGAGGIGQAYAEASRFVEEARLAAIVDVSSDGARELAEVHDVPYLADPRQVVNMDGIDLALICTPPATHEDITLMYLNAGVPVICEKPLAPTRAAAQHMIATSASTGTPLTMASKFRFVQDVVSARSMVRNGLLGDIVSAHVAFCAPVDMSHRWNSRRDIAGGGVLIDNGTHGMDMLRFVLGPIESVFTSVSTSAPGMEVEDTAVTLVRMASGPLATVTVSWATDMLTDRYMSVHGTMGSLEVGWRNSRMRVRSAASDEPFGDGYDKLHALGGNLRNVARFLSGVEDLRVTQLDAMASIDAIEAAYESLQKGGWVGVAGTAERAAA